MKKDTQMHDLVKLTIGAHRGLEEWSQISRISAAFTVSGVSFKQRGPIGEAFAALPMRVSVDTREQQSIFEPSVEALNNPRDSLKTKELGAP